MSNITFSKVGSNCDIFKQVPENNRGEFRCTSRLKDFY